MDYQTGFILALILGLIRLGVDISSRYGTFYQNCIRAGTIKPISGLSVALAVLWHVIVGPLFSWVGLAITGIFMAINYLSTPKLHQSETVKKALWKLNNSALYKDEVLALLKVVETGEEQS